MDTYKSKSNGEFHIVKLTPEIVMKMASTIFLQMSKGEKVDNCYWNKTFDDQFQIKIEL